MQIQIFNTANIKPRWLKVLILLLIGLPVISGWPLSALILPNENISNILVSLTYSCFVWLFILLNVGLKQLITYLSFAFSMAMFMAIAGALVRYGIAFMTHQSQNENEFISIKMISLFIAMVSVIPYSLFFINCFSVSRYVSKLALSDGRRFELKLHIALAIRVFQHVGDVVSNLLWVWREENPAVIKPRFRDDWEKSMFSYVAWINWIKNSTISWSVALLIHTLEALPYLTEELNTIRELKHLKQKKDE